MNRHFFLVLGLALPLCANAFRDQIVHLKGVTVTATRSSERACGVEFLIAVSDGDQHLVEIDFSYNGTFRTSPGSELTPAGYASYTTSNKMNISVGRFTYEGNLGRVAAMEFPDNTLSCSHAWAFQFTASEYNASQKKRDEQAELERKQQERIDEANRIKAAREEQKRKAQQRQIDMQLTKETAEREYLAEYSRTRGTAVDGSRCIIRDRADIQRCEESNARILETNRQLEEKALQAKREEEARTIAAARQAALFKASEEEYERRRMLTTEQKCAEEAAWIQKGPPTGPGTGSQLVQMQAQWNHRKAMVEAQCGNSINPSQAQNQGAQQLLAEQNRILAQQKAQADLDAAIQRGKITVNEAASNTQSMQNDNADLMNLINRMK